MSQSNELDDVDGGWGEDEQDGTTDGELREESGVSASAASDGERDDSGGKSRSRRRRKRRDPGAPEVADERAEAALQFVTRLIQKMQMDCDVRVRRPKAAADGEIHIEVSGRDAGRIIGKKGQVLAAVQFLTNRVVNRSGLERRYVSVDAEGYRSRRDSSLASMARRLGKQAVDEGKIITFEPMNPRDRRVVHLALAKFDGVVTKSEGEGDDRRVQIIPVRRSPG